MRLTRHVLLQTIRRIVTYQKNIEYVRLKRDTDISADYDNIRYFEDNEACAKALNNTDGNILLTTGSKELVGFTGMKDYQNRLYARVLSLPM